jgi:hypothetical protein
MFENIIGIKVDTRRFYPYIPLKAYLWFLDKREERDWFPG